MASSFRRIACGIAILAGLAAPLAAQPPRIENGAVRSQPAGAPFASSFRALVAAQPGTAWIGYSVPVLDRERTMCCGNAGTTFVNGSTVNGCCSACRLESSSGTSITSRASAPANAAGPIKLEGGDRMVVLFRVAEHAIERVRVFSEDCQLDAGGRPVEWLENVSPADSVALLESLSRTEGDPKGRITDGAVAAIALHADRAADAALERLVAPGQPEGVRKKVTFWLGNARGRPGFDALKRVLRDDPSIEVRKSAIFGLSQSSVPETLDALLNIARTDSEPRLRGEALFWLAQKAGQKVSAAIADRVDQDPDTDVKKKAVFALSQLPRDEGVPLLIKVARTNANLEVRKQAMFWLGQSRDPRAIDFFSEVLGK
jgi:HEAT repeats/PBS lyase HEAT-like repeat